MKNLFLLLLIASVFTAQAQSRSYQDLQRNFGGEPEVRSFGFGGPLCRLIVSILGDDDAEMSEALKGVKHVRFMTIPTEEFANRGLSVNGFRKRLESDDFEMMARFKDSGTNLTFYHRSEKKTDRYFLLIEEDDELVAVEMKGYIDPAAFNNRVTESSL